ncbi:MAG: helix-turn-helix transcriptional regulator [Microbacterium ginsengisoli]|nr:helix-turn-helix transcriptional regulator [Microbacterium ginsengisoli]
MKVRDDFRVAPTGRLVSDRVKVIFVISGWARFSYQESSIDVAAGAIIVVPGAQWCAYTPHGYVRTVTLYLHRDFLRAQMPWMPVSHPLMHLLDTAIAAQAHPGVLLLDDDAMRSLTPRVLALAAKDRENDQDPIGLFALVTDVMRHVDVVAGLSGGIRGDESKRLGPPRSEVKNAIRLLIEQPQARWTVEELARAVALSTSQLTRLFRAEVGLSPGAYVWRVRLDRIAELLATTSMDIATATQAAGWTQPSAASRAFRRRFGISPREFAAQMRTFGSNVLTPTRVEEGGPQ